MTVTALKLVETPEDNLQQRANDARAENEHAERVVADAEAQARAIKLQLDDTADDLKLIHKLQADYAAATHRAGVLTRRAAETQQKNAPLIAMATRQQKQARLDELLPTIQGVKGEPIASSRQRLADFVADTQRRLKSLITELSSAINAYNGTCAEVESLSRDLGDAQASFRAVTIDAVVDELSLSLQDPTRATDLRLVCFSAAGMASQQRAILEINTGVLVEGAK